MMTLGYKEGPQPRMAQAGDRQQTTQKPSGRSPSGYELWEVCSTVPPSPLPLEYPTVKGGREEIWETHVPSQD